MIEMMLSIIVIQMVVHIIQTTLVMIVMYYGFDNPLQGSLVTLSILMMITGFSGMFFGNYHIQNYYLNRFYLYENCKVKFYFWLLGFMLAVINNDMTITAYTGIGTNIVLCFTSGNLWKPETASIRICSFWLTIYSLLA